MPGQRGEKAILSELNFISLPAHTVSYDSLVVWNYNVTFFFFFLTARARYSEGTAATAVIEILIRNKFVYMRLPLRRWPADCGGVFPRMHLNETNNGSSVLDHRKKEEKKFQER